jgi:hypothetical protein
MKINTVLTKKYTKEEKLLVGEFCYLAREWGHGKIRISVY